MAITALWSARCSPSKALIAISDRLAVIGASVTSDTAIIANFISFVAATLVRLMLLIERIDIRRTLAGQTIATTIVGDQEGRTGARVVAFRHIFGSCSASRLILYLVLSDPGDVSVWNWSTDRAQVGF